MRGVLSALHTGRHGYNIMAESSTHVKKEKHICNAMQKAVAHLPSHLRVLC